MILLNKIKNKLKNTEFDVEYEANMVQSRLLSPIIQIIEEKKITQKELSEKTGLTQPFISALLNIRKKLNMEHIALFQKALNIVIQTPSVLSKEEHNKKFYDLNDYANIEELSNKIWSFNQMTFKENLQLFEKKENYKKKKETFIHLSNSVSLFSYDEDLISI